MEVAAHSEIEKLVAMDTIRRQQIHGEVNRDRKSSEEKNTARSRRWRRIFWRD
jgi:hypothetical protein